MPIDFEFGAGVVVVEGSNAAMNVRCLKFAERVGLADEGAAARFYARVGGRWGFNGEETALAVQLRAASLEHDGGGSVVLREDDAIWHLNSARTYLRVERTREAAEPPPDPEAMLRGVSAVLRDLTERLLWVATRPRLAKPEGESEP